MLNGPRYLYSRAILRLLGLTLIIWVLAACSSRSGPTPPLTPEGKDTTPSPTQEPGLTLVTQMSVGSTPQASNTPSLAGSVPTSCAVDVCVIPTQGTIAPSQTPAPPRPAGETPALRTSYPTQDLCPTAVTLGIPCPTFIAVFGGVSEPYSFPSPTLRSDQPVAIEPVDTAGLIRVISWSPDGKWLAYWSSTQAQAAAYLADPSNPAEQPPATLAFYNADGSRGTRDGDEACLMEQFSNREGPVTVEWSAQGNAIIGMSDGTFSGTPCQPESFHGLGFSQATSPPKSAGTLPVPTAFSSTFPQFSFGGLYRAETRQTNSQGGILTFETRLVPSSGGLPIVAKTWQIDQRLGGYEGFLGGEWISSEEFLIYETLDEGPLVLDTHGNVLSVLKDLLHIQDIPSIHGQGGYNLVAAAIPGDTLPGGAESGNYHLLVYGEGDEADLPEVRLYHGEYDLVETLPFRYFRAASPDNKWLLMDLRPTIDGHEASALYFRPLELVEGDWTLLAYDQDSYTWNDHWSEMAFNSGEVITWQDFPDLNLLGTVPTDVDGGGVPTDLSGGRWRTTGYIARLYAGAKFSADSCRLAFSGAHPGNEGDSALFVIDRCR